MAEINNPRVIHGSRLLGLWLRLECSLDCIIYVSEGFDVPRDYRSRRGRETIKRYDVTETYSTWYVKTFQKRQLRVLNPARINVV